MLGVGRFGETKPEHYLFPSGKPTPNNAGADTWNIQRRIGLAA